MSPTSFLLSTLRHYWRTNLAVWLGVVVGTAVLGGALLVGDSVRGSLRQMALDRLGGVDHALSGPRFFREDLAVELLGASGVRDQFETVAPAISLSATFERRDENSPVVSARAGHVNLHAVDQRFWSLVESAGEAAPRDNELILSQGLSDQLGVSPGDSLTAVVELPAAVPRDSLLGQRDETSASIPFKVKAVLPESSGLGRFGLQPNQQLPLNAFVSLKTVQAALGLAQGEPAGDPPQPVFARCNTLFAGSRDAGGGNPDSVEILNQALAKTWTLADLDLRVAVHPDRGYFALESRRMILDRVSAAAGRKVARQQSLVESPVLVYLANELSAGHEEAISRYSVVAGVAPELFDAGRPSPFGPFEFAGSRPERTLGEGEILTGGPGEILINEWLAQDLKAKPGDTVQLTWHVVGSHGELPEESRPFKVLGVLKLAGTPAADRGFTPEVHGITDVESFDEWNQPFPMKKVTRRDDEYWGAYRATPKAFVTLKTAEHLWKSRYGDVTSLRLASGGSDLAKAAAEFEATMRKTLTPSEAGLVFQPVKALGLSAANGTQDFAQLFLGFSFFLIMAALALISLLFRLGVERRASQLGLLLATGFSPTHVRRLLLLEALVIVATGGLAGLGAAVGYAWLMLYGLKTWWYGAIGTRFLDLYVTLPSLAIGLGVSAGIALLAVWWRLRDLVAIPVRALLGGATEQALTGSGSIRRGRLTAGLTLGGLAMAVLLSASGTAGLVPQTEAFSGFSWPTIGFFVAGLCALTSGIAGLSMWVDSDRSAAVRGRGLFGHVRLGIRNAGRQKSRTVLTAGLIATATFLIVVIAAAHKNPTGEKPDLRSGNGGFSWVAESSVPILHDLNDPAGRAALGLDDAESAAPMSLLKQAVAFRRNPGENASCLNIYQTSQPTILGVPPEMIHRGGFEFVGARESNPWTLLDRTEPDGAIPVLGDMNTLQYSLHKGVGSAVEIRDEQNQPVTLRVAGMLDGSIFQGVLLMSERHFVRLFPSRGYQYFLLEAGTEVPATLSPTVPVAFSTRYSNVDMAVWGRLDVSVENGIIPVAMNHEFAHSILGLTEGAVFDARRADGTGAMKLRVAALLERTPQLSQMLAASVAFSKHVSAHDPAPVKFLVPASPIASQSLSDLLESKIPGFDAQPVSDRLADFLAVQNTYLSTFQTLGGLGLLLGTMGLATVMLRNVLERRSELALLKAVGFTSAGVAAIVLAENALLLMWGLAVGAGSALLAMLPHLSSTGADFSWAWTALTLAAVFAAGMLAATLSIGEALRSPVLQALREE